MNSVIDTHTTDIVVTFPSPYDTSVHMAYLAMTNNDYAASTASPLCPKNKSSWQYYEYLCGQGAIKTFAPGCDWTLAKYNQNGDVVTAFTFGIGKDTPPMLHVIPMAENKLDSFNKSRSDRQLVPYTHFNPK